MYNILFKVISTLLFIIALGVGLDYAIGRSDSIIKTIILLILCTIMTILYVGIMTNNQIFKPKKRNK